MTDKEIYHLFCEAANYTDPDAFVSDITFPLLDQDNPGQKAGAEIFGQLRTIWHIANDPFRAFLSCIGLTQTQCSLRFCVPLRTVQDWAGGRRNPPIYVRLMMAELEGLFSRVQIRVQFRSKK